MSETYYRPHDLSRFSEMGKERPELWAKFLDYYNAVFADGALTAREKALIALGVAHAVQCPYCIDAYTQASLQNGADREQLTEAGMGVRRSKRAGSRCCRSTSGSCATRPAVTATWTRGRTGAR